MIGHWHKKNLEQKMSLRANLVLLAGEVKRSMANADGSIVNVQISVPASRFGRRETNEDGTVKMMNLTVTFRDDTAETGKALAEGDYVDLEAVWYQQPMKFDNKENTYKVMMLQAKAGTITISKGKGVELAAQTGGGKNLAIFGGTVIKNGGIQGDKTKRVHLTVACEPKYDKNRSVEEKKALTTYMDVTAFGGLADKWLYKAEVKNHLLVIGSVSTRKRDDYVVKGRPVPCIEITIDDVSLEKHFDAGSGGGSGGGGGGGTGAKPGLDDDLPF